MARNIEPQAGPGHTDAGRSLTQTAPMIGGGNPHNAVAPQKVLGGASGVPSPVLQGGATGAPAETARGRLVTAPPVQSVYDPRKAQGGPNKRRYRVLIGGGLLQNGNRTNIRAGKIVDDLNYTIEGPMGLKAQGIRLEEIFDEEPMELEEEREQEVPVKRSEKRQPKRRGQKVEAKQEEAPSSEEELDDDDSDEDEEEGKKKE